MNVVQQWSRDRLETALHMYWYGYEADARDLLKKIVNVVVKEYDNYGEEEKAGRGSPFKPGGNGLAKRKLSYVHSNPVECSGPTRWSETRDPHEG